MFLRFGNTLLQDKVMVGLSAAGLGIPAETLIAEYLALPLKESVMEKWLFTNASVLRTGRRTRRVSLAQMPWMRWQSGGICIVGASGIG